MIGVWIGEKQEFELAGAVKVHASDCDAPLVGDGLGDLSGEWARKQAQHQESTGSFHDLIEMWFEFLIAISGTIILRIEPMEILNFYNV